MKKVMLKKGKEKPVLNRHPWIFSGALSRRDSDIEDGEIVAIQNHAGALLGYGYFSSRSQIAVRILSFGDVPVNHDHLKKLISSANRKRLNDPLLRGTNAYRVIFSEGDFFPGLIVDRYDAHLVIQILTMGIERLREDILGILTDCLSPDSIYERSDHAGRAIEGLKERTGQLTGTTPGDILIGESGVLFHVDVYRGQKTGFFLDQRENRGLVKSLAAGRNVLDLFSYTGGFSMAALRGGALKVISLDASPAALEMASVNARENDGDSRHSCVNADVFEYIRAEQITSNLIIIDPPALAKHRDAVDSACRGYKDLNLYTMKKCPPGTLILTCSCSRFISMDLFQKVVFSAAADSGRTAGILRKSHHPSDHPISIYHPESEYLKSMLLYIE
jgi:23S rRNA (cytosine1962-C5)-methyltransferase